MKGQHICALFVMIGSLQTGAWIHAASALHFAKSSYSAQEWAGQIALVVQRTNDLSTAVSVAYATADGTAKSGVDYVPANGTLAFAPGETNKTFVLSILNDGLVENPKRFSVALSNPQDSVLGVPASVAVTINDVDVGIRFPFDQYNTANGWSWTEDVGTVLIGVVRGDDADFPVSVDFATSDLTATNGIHYAGVTNTLHFAPQERVKYVPIPIMNDPVKQPNRRFRATLSNPAGVSLGDVRTTSITIIDNDPGFEFESGTNSIPEDAGVALIAVLRGTDELSSTTTVEVVTAGISAVEELDYNGVTNTLSFGPGERRQVFSVPILNDRINEGTESFRVTLRNPGGGASLGSRTNCTVSILDNDPGTGFEFSSYSTPWNPAGTFTLTVVRGSDAAQGPFAVDYATIDATAKAGEDYGAISGTLTFNQNETAKSLFIPILRSRSSKTFRVLLSNATGGAQLGRSNAIVRIEGWYASVAPPFETQLAIHRENGLTVLSWKGGGLLQTAVESTGTWLTLSHARPPCAIQTAGPRAFYRVTLPRPQSVYVPSSYTGEKIPLVLFLHGYGSTRDTYEPRLKLESLADARGFLLCYPAGTLDRLGDPYWNGTDINDSWNDQVDDAGYLRALIETIGRQFTVDPKRVYVIGHSTGGDMAFTMGCHSADLIAAIAPIAGNTYLDRTRCTPANLVNVLCTCGTSDQFDCYYGGAPFNLPAYPGAVRSVQIWAEYNSARDPVMDLGPSLDISTTLGGLDTIVTRYTTHAPGGAVELWSVLNGDHDAPLSSKFSSQVIDWLFAHPKP